MPRKSKLLLRSFPITRFTGIETKYSSISQKAGTLRRADGTNVVPLGTLSFGPNWQPGWGLTNLAALITAALNGADPTKTHFVTVSQGGYEFLVAWDLANGRPQGIWQVAGLGNPFSTTASATTVNPVAHNHTERITFTGGALPRTVVLSDTGRLAGDRCVVDCAFPAVSGIQVSFYDNAAYLAGGSPLAVFTTDGIITYATFEFDFNAAGAWEYMQAQAPS